MHNYYIQPKPRLLTLIDESKQLDDDTKYVFQLQQFWYSVHEPRLIQRYETEDSTIQRIKFVFLANFHLEYFHSEDAPNTRRFLLELLGNLPWSIESFDEWWRIDIMDLEYDVEQSLDSKDINAIKFQNPRNYSWFNKLRDEKGNNSS